ncbi:MAG: PilZ domain-containing protein [Candidatus Omnitrophica bacterium]|nr:PilZ domain-containing protein [Candidatus Omnitrophota bacterium]
MLNNSKPEQRKHARYDTEIEVKFFVSFDLDTRIDFRIQEEKKEGDMTHQYHAIGKNVSAEGLSFHCGRNLKKGDILLLDVFVPSDKDPVRMIGQVRWSSLCKSEKIASVQRYETGVKLLAVNGEDVEKTVFLDEINKIMWSNVLESVFGRFKHSMFARKNGA